MSRSAEEFKGIALFTPGGDLVYCIAPHKQARWHRDLCATLQARLALPTSPEFLLPCYTATVESWQDPTTGQWQLVAEAYPRVMRYQALLNTVFDLDALSWQPVYSVVAGCSTSVLGNYRQQSPQLWQYHDLVLQVPTSTTAEPATETPTATFGDSPTGYVLRLFVAGYTSTTEYILTALQATLDQYLQQPYTLKVVDVYKHPEQAETDQVSATPTLVRVWPYPARRLVGDLDNVDRILSLLKG
ncbi:Circadian clock protein KaiB [Halomicronema hongdechloris C2206]|uniref:Circadian clock protein KaiB n=1 Tax=Halomicronema hongdechloris C2206 TaxID=1641165 RepID=A0A1Z3HKY3_9CYAN|nr:circadian clock KaiB family protein [Halomicronema hongdechloris]ASC70960.1 Circadian clock protein KaiB [Halomicronema hongdechloris C2206]